MFTCLADMVVVLFSCVALDVEPVRILHNLPYIRHFMSETTRKQFRNLHQHDRGVFIPFYLIIRKPLAVVY
jgi:hypothetical protein